MSELEQGLDIEVGGEDEAPEIEIIDDTPEEDRGRKPLQAETVPDAQEDELETYSAGVKKRINQLSHRYHDERRAKEELARQNQEAIALAQSILAENQQLKQTLTWGQQEYVNEVKAKIEYAEKLAEDKYRKAYESGDTEGVLAAQKELQQAGLQKERLADFKPPIQESAQTPLQTQQAPVYNAPQAAQQRYTPPPVDAKAEEWATRNPWFGEDAEMTSLAYGLHSKLVNSGVNTQSDEYYAAIDKRMREVYPEYFGKAKKSSPVAPAGRSTSTKKVTLTATQVALAKRLGVSLEDYAKHAAKLEKRANG
jgi:hypothetical protein